jgi:hypothetical protein
VGFLKVEAPNVGMLVDELVELSRVGASVGRVKDVIWALNSLLLTEECPQLPNALAEAKIIPVNLGNAPSKLQSSKSDFFIRDRQKFADAFEGKALMLDFTLKEAHMLQPFLHWMGLENRYMSRAVKEISTFKGSPKAPISSPDRDFRCKAHALYR